MARKVKYRPANDPEPGLDISSLIDVSFLLLIYFLVTTTLKPKEVDVGIRLPSAISGGTPPELPPLSLALEEDGTVIAHPDQSAESLGRMDDKFRNLKLFQRLNDYKETADRAGQTARIMLRASNAAENQKLITVFNEISAVGIEDVTLDGFLGEE